MRRLPGILLLTVATLIVIVALLVSGLRLVLPQLDAWRPQLLEKISTLTGTPVDASQITASWQTFGPTLDARDIHVGLKDGGTMAVKRVTRRWMSGRACCICAGSSATSPSGSCRSIPIPLFRPMTVAKA
ncbi:hypothetical protein RBI21_24105 [Klebsiella pneumoniae]|nr:hypothetical protein RBI21_24105 [Klebsiella pneumoniae]